MGLTNFLLARITEDEEMANGGLGQFEITPPGMWSADRVLAQCEAKRRIVEHADEVSGMDMQIEGEWGTRGSVPWDEDQGVLLLRFLALPYADHPDYEETWRP